jgi:hypothetical protein
MQIRQHGLSYQILMPAYEQNEVRSRQKVVGRLSMSISDPDEAIRDLEAQLIETRQKFEAQAIRADLVLAEDDRQKLRDFFAAREAKREDFRRAKFVLKAPGLIVNAAAELMQNDNTLPTAEGLIFVFEKMALAMVRDKYISEMFKACADATEEGFKHNELPEDEAVKIVKAWISIKHSLERQGYTTAWYKRYKDNNRDR